MIQVSILFLLLLPLCTFGQSSAVMADPNTGELKKPLSFFEANGVSQLGGEIDLASEVTGVLQSANGGAGTVNGVVKANGSGTTSAAVAGTDYVYPGVDTTVFYDDFNRADTASSTLTNAPSGQSWVVNGSGSANGRINTRRLTSVSPYGTQYFWPQLGFTPTRWGFRFRITDGPGAGSGVYAAGQVGDANSVNGGMIHFLGNTTNWSIELWPDDGLGPVNKVVLHQETFAQPLEYGRDYTFEFVVDAANDTVTIYPPTGNIVTVTESRVSDFATPYIFVEAALDSSPTWTIAWDRMWAANASSVRGVWLDAMEGAAASGFPAYQLTSLTGLTGNVTSSAGVISMAADTDTSGHAFGRLRVVSTSDIGGISHYDNASLAAAMIYQNTLGTTFLNAPTGQTIQAYINGSTHLLSMTTLGIEIQGTTRGLIYEGTANAFETSVFARDPLSDATIYYPQGATGDVSLMPPLATAGAVTDPGVDAFKGWDDSATAEIYFTPDSSIIVSGTAFGVAQATDTLAGKVELADQTEAEGKTDNAKAMTSLRVAQQIANTPYLIYQDQKSSGTVGGTFTTGSWQTRTLNTEVADTEAIGSVASNEVTLPAGTYWITWRAPAYKVNQHQTRLYNVTDASVVGYGEVSCAPDATDVQTTSIGTALVTIAGSKAFRIEHQSGDSQTSTGFGLACGFGGTEVYASMEIRKLD